MNQKTLKLGAAPYGDDMLILVIRSDKHKPWSGKLCFDIPRHREYMGFAKDWPRMNTLPEWFTVEAERQYTIWDLDSGEKTTRTGKELNAGLNMDLPAGVQKRIAIQRGDAVSAGALRVAVT